jgi:hypothetical protein
MGGFLSLVISTLRYTIPRNIALFGPRVGCINVTIGFGIAFFPVLFLLYLLQLFPTSIINIIFKGTPRIFMRRRLRHT